MLAISYIADPSIDMALLEDKYGIISDLKSYLDKSLTPDSWTGFSVQELVEGLANLAVHPINKYKVIDKSLHLLYTILERNINEKLTFYVREVLEGWGFSDVRCPTSSDKCKGEMEKQNKSEHHREETNESANNMQMLDNLQCVLSECDNFGTNEVMEIIVAVRRIVDKADGRQIILQHMTMHEWPDLLVRIMSDVWISDNDVYTDNVSWTIITETILTLRAYSDADVEFADVLIEHGALEMMQKVANAYWQHFRQKLIALDEKVREYRGERIPSEHPGADEHQSMDTTQINDLLKPEATEHHGASDSSHCGQADTDRIPKSSSENSQERESSSEKSGASYTLKPVSQYACVNEDATIAYRKRSDVVYNRAVFVSNEPIESSTLFELNIDKIAGREMFSLELGVCMYKEFPDGTLYEGNRYGEGIGFWFLSDNDLWKDFKSIGGGYKLNLRNIHLNDRVGFVKHSDGTMGFLYNGQYQGIAFRNIPEDVYALVATTGRCVQVSITGDSGTTIQQEISASIPTEPFELFSVKTNGPERKYFSRMRVPFGLDFTDEEKHPEMRKLYKRGDGMMRKLNVKMEKASTKRLEICERSFKGYLNEIDMRTQLSYSVRLYHTHRHPRTRIDPISKEIMLGITKSVTLNGLFLKLLQKNNYPPKATNTLPKRLKQIFNVVRPCIDNIQDVSGIVWTGSTSEGFAIADNSGPGTTYVDDEMDLMIPLAMATEDSQRNPLEYIAITMQTISGSANELQAKANERGDLKTESLVTELENIGKRQQSKEYPSFIWRPSSHPGYVSIVIPESIQSYLSEGFIKHICAKSTSSNGRSDLLLTRSNLLAIQAEYIKGRLPAVQSHITTVEEGQFQGQLRLVQEGPVQTISVRYETQEAGGSVLEFDQTVDVAIALNGVDWPTIANPWISRKRHWPEKTIVDKIIKDGYHIVPKYYPGGSGIDIEWRLSFSVAERTLAHTFTDNQRMCYMVFKKLWRKYLKVPKVLSSYHIKTTMFWLCERTSLSDWMESDVGERYLDLQNFLIRFLQRYTVPNFFIPENNMISNVDPADVKIILAKAQDIRRRQLFFLRDLAAPSTSLNITDMPTPYK